MNQPVVSPAVTAAINAGGIVLFEGGTDPLRAGFGAVLSELIKAVTHSNYSHSAMLPPNSGMIFESTIKNGISGPQENSLSSTLTEYGNEGGHAWVFNFLPQFAPDWDAVATFQQQLIALRVAGKMPYNVRRLFEDGIKRSWVADVVFLPADGVILYLGDHSKGIVCSEDCGLSCQAGGVVTKLTAAGIPWLPNVAPPNQPIGCSPQDLADMPMFSPPVQLL